MATILVVSDTGSVSLTMDHTDWPTQAQCVEMIASHYQSPPPREFNGHLVTAKVSASCVPVTAPVVARGGQRQQMPPGFPFPQFFQ